MTVPSRIHAVAPFARTGRPYRRTGRAHAVAPFFLSATLFLLVAGALALAQLIDPWFLPGLAAWRWPAVHLAFVGGATQLIVGAIAFFAVTLLMTDAPPAWLTRAQWLLVNAGALALAGGSLYRSPWLSAAGGMAVLATLALLWTTIRLLQRRSLARPNPALLYYKTAIVLFMVGATLGILMVLGLSDPFVPRGRIRLAHTHLNLIGWITLTIVGTMRYFFGTVLERPARHLAPLWAEYWPLTLGTAAQALGWLTGLAALTGVGGVLQTAGIVAYAMAIVRQWRARPGPLALAAAHLLAATGWLLVTTFGGLVVGALAMTGAGGAARWAAALTAASFIGFIGQTILGAWTHLFSAVVALPGGALPAQPAPLRPRLRAVLAGQGRPQLLLTNAGVAGVALGAGLAPSLPLPAAVVAAMGQAALAIVLALVTVKAGWVLVLIWLAWRRRETVAVPA